MIYFTLAKVKADNTTVVKKQNFWEFSKDYKSDRPLGT